ncbi:diguanylate cyclase [Marinibactrum halimedae]|uniref:diguanylate cyclase n=1 Tax=Marinibactrum halimedae TaxID=1444977 RepID=A0AA37TA28_9GAMM|nr:diguanylate cyclase [Marinibactrum halimedae]MCD9457464.1 diguanylate cyclase [Marinibactrum halimedae]GLS25482.1 diguanylate cyclase response regulator [Marinibactrum halimedae]
MGTILIVDDIPDNIKLLLFELEDDGYRVITATNGREGVDSAIENDPELILLDLHMPVLNGIEALKELKAHSKTHDTPVIIISANDDIEDIIKALDLGAHDYVSKPLVYPVLAARIRSALRIQEQKHALATANDELIRLATQDPLTGINNRRSFFDLSEREISRAERLNLPSCALMMDIDHFKRLNDNYGHNVGDNALIHVTETIQHCIRPSDIFGRYGGEEFVLCCPDTNLSVATSIGERIRHSVEHTPYQHEQTPITITLSIGIALWMPHTHGFEETLKDADTALYAAKRKGRNCCHTYSDNSLSA